MSTGKAYKFKSLFLVILPIDIAKYTKIKSGFYANRAKTTFLRVIVTFLIN